MGIIAKLVEEDFGISGHGRWLRSEKHSSLVVDTEKDLFYFNAQDIIGGPLDYLTKVRGLSFLDARKYLSKFKEYSDTYVYTINNRDEDVVVYPKLIDTFFMDGLKHRDYWYERTLTDETINRFSLGYTGDWYTIPIYMGGTFRNFQIRRDNPKRVADWYKNVGPLLFNSDILKLTNKIIISEGLTDCLALNQNGIPAVSNNHGAEVWLDDWFSNFLFQKDIIILYDNDSAGNIGAKKLAKKLGIYRCKIYTFSGLEKSYDAVKFFQDKGTKKDLEEMINKNAKFLFELRKDTK